MHAAPPPEYKNTTVAYLLWFFLGMHYLYLRRPGIQLIYWLTAGGLFIWAFIDLFRIPAMIDSYNWGAAQSQGQPRKSSGGFATVALLIIVIGLGFLAFKNRLSPDRGEPVQLRAIPSGPEVVAAQQRAIQRFPALGVKGSTLNNAFLQTVQQARSERPEVFDNPDWPTVLASEAAKLAN